MALTQISGSVWNTTGNIVVNLTEDLPDVAEEGIIFVSGYLTLNDGGGGWYKYELSIHRSTADGTNVVDPSGTGVGNGCWVRQNFISAQMGVNKSEKQIAVLGQTDFTIHTFVYRPGYGELAVYVQGLRLTPDMYQETSPNTVTLITPLRDEMIVEFIAHEQPQPGTQECTPALEICYDNTLSNMQAENVQDAIDELAMASGTSGTLRLEILWTAVAGQTSFLWEHNTAALDVYLNGIKLDPLLDYTADGSNIVLTVPIKDGSDRLIGVTYSEVGEGEGGAEFSSGVWTNVAGQSAFPWPHDPSKMAVYLNGSKLIFGVDYLADGTTVTLVKPIVDAADYLEAISFVALNTGGGTPIYVPMSQYLIEQAIQDADIQTLLARPYITVSDNDPATVDTNLGHLWWNSVTNVMSIYYEDTSGDKYWIATTT